MENERPTRMSQALTATAFAGVLAIAFWQAPHADWDLALFGILLGFSAFSDIMSIETESHLKVSGTFRFWTCFRKYCCGQRSNRASIPGVKVGIMA